MIPHEVMALFTVFFYFVCLSFKQDEDKFRIVLLSFLAFLVTSFGSFQVDRISATYIVLLTHWGLALYLLCAVKSYYYYFNLYVFLLVFTGVVTGLTVGILEMTTLNTEVLENSYWILCDICTFVQFGIILSNIDGIFNRLGAGFFAVNHNSKYNSCGSVVARQA